MEKRTFLMALLVCVAMLGAKAHTVVGDEIFNTLVS